MGKVATNLNLFESLARGTSSTSLTELAKVTNADALLLSDYTSCFITSPLYC